MSCKIDYLHGQTEDIYQPLPATQPQYPWGLMANYNRTLMQMARVNAMLTFTQDQTLKRTDKAQGIDNLYQ